MIAVLLSAVAMTGCQMLVTRDATITVKVVDMGSHAVTGKEVYMFSAKSERATLANKTKAKQTSITDSRGETEFTVSKGEFLGDNMMTYFFETFDSQGQVESRKAVSVGSGDSKTVELILGILYN